VKTGVQTLVPPKKKKKKKKKKESKKKIEGTIVNKASGKSSTIHTNLHEIFI
jgi:hypothetical protein